MPRVSFLMPVYNARRTLPRAIGSMVAQTLEDFDVVIVDDGSTDGSSRILEDLASRDPRVTLVTHEHNRGIVAALQTGLRLVQSGLVARMDADDVSLPQRLEKQVEALRLHPDWSVASCRVQLCAESLIPNRGMQSYVAWMNELLTPEAISASRFIESPLIHTSAVIRTKVLRAAGGYRDAPTPEDYDLWLRLLSKGNAIGKVDAVLLEHYDSPGRLTRTDPRCSRDAFWECKLHHLQRLLQGCSPRVSWGAGRTGKRLLRDMLQRECGFDFVADTNPRRVGHVIHGAKVIAPEELPRLYRELIQGVGENGKQIAGASHPSPVVIAVAQRQSHLVIRTMMAEQGWLEGRDYFFVAGMDAAGAQFSSSIN